LTATDSTKDATSNPPNPNEKLERNTVSSHVRADVPWSGSSRRAVRDARSGSARSGPVAPAVDAAARVARGVASLWAGMMALDTRVAWAQAGVVSAAVPTATSVSARLNFMVGAP